MSRLNKFLRPSNIAIIGASRKEGSLGKMFLDTIIRMNYTGKILPVNPKADAISGIQCFREIDELPDDLDLAVILLPHKFVLSSMQELAKKNIKNIIVISAGFKEVGGEGIERENQLKELIQKHHLTVIGPNCMGIFNTDGAIQLDATFSPIDPFPGHVAFISQSGALGVGILELSTETRLGFSVFASTGNKADVDEVDFLEFLVNDENTRVITLYQESVDRAPKFRQICQHVVAKKPVLTVKAGRGQKAQQAASSHTGALASPDGIVDAFLKQCGIIRCETIKEMLDTARAMDTQEIPKGNRVAILTNAGGPSILATDALEQAGLTLPTLSEETQQKLREFLPAEAAVKNPVDMIASANHDTYRKTFDILAAEDNIDIILPIIVKPPVDTTPARIIQNMGESIRKTSKTVVATVMAQQDETAGLDHFRELGVPVYEYPEEAANVIGKMNQYREIRQVFAQKSHQQKDFSAPLEMTKENEQAELAHIFELFEKYNLSLAPYVISNKVNQIIKFAEKVDTPIVLKIANKEIIHKSDAGLVKVNLRNTSSITAAFDKIIQKSPKYLPEGDTPMLLAQAMVKGFPELVIGAKRDCNFGPTIMFGLGGVLVEALKDVVFRVAPLDRDDALSMIEELKGNQLLKGFRQYSAVDLDQIAEMLINISQLLLDHPEIQEMDLNPIIWSPTDNRPFVVDARMTIMS